MHHCTAVWDYPKYNLRKKVTRPNCRSGKQTTVQKIRHFQQEMAQKPIPIGSFLAFTGIVHHGHAVEPSQEYGS